MVVEVDLPPGKLADIQILNIFEPGPGDVITFPQTGFRASQAVVGGRTIDFAEYVRQRGIDTRLPLVADHAGAMINTSFQKVDPDGVALYAPVFAGVEYRVAKPVGDYVAAFTRKMPARIDGDLVFSCNCILNYLYSQLEEKKTGPFVGPITFGEVAYQLVNQTLVYLTVLDE